MYEERQIGCYNVTIYDGHLDNETNTWYYAMNIDKFDIGDNWEGSKHFYIKGHEDKNVGQKNFINHMIQLWLNNLTAREVSQIFIMFRNNYKFKMAEPQLVSCV